MGKKYYWLKLKEDFFRQKEIKKLRKIAGGDTFTIIYLKLQLLSLKDEGKLFFEGVEDNFIEEMALELDEDIENVRLTLLYLEKHKLIQVVNEDEYHLAEAIASIGSESESTERVRRFRDRKKKKLGVTCNGNVTESNTEIEKEIEKEKELILTQEESDFISILSTVRNYPLDQATDIDLLKKLQERYKNTYILECTKDWAIYKADKPLTKKSNPRSQLNTWCKNDSERFHKHDKNKNSNIALESNNLGPRKQRRVLD